MKLLFIMFFAPGLALACMNDFDCGYGNKCVKSAKDYSMQGICVTPVDKFGNKDYSPSTPKPTPHKIPSCQFDTDCEIGYSCMKKSGSIYGMCMK